MLRQFWGFHKSVWYALQSLWAILMRMRDELAQNMHKHVSHYLILCTMSDMGCISIIKSNYCNQHLNIEMKTKGDYLMLEVQGTINQTEVHDPVILSHAKTILDACSSPQEMQDAVLAAVARNEEWRGKRCLNLLAPEALTSPAVRALLSAEVGTRAAEGHIGPVNRWFAGTRHIDQMQALCFELVK